MKGGGYGETLGGDGYVHGPKGSAGFMGVYASLNPSSYTLRKACNFYVLIDLKVVKKIRHATFT